MATPLAEPDKGSASQPLPPTNKPIHSLVLDTGPLIKNDPSVSALLSQAEQLYTIPSVVSEIRDPATRARVETTLLPFVKVRTPGPASIKFVSDFARKTGDLAVLSRPDIEVIALGYELECERNHGDWRLRNTPAQKGLNGRPQPAGETEAKDNEGAPTAEEDRKEQVEQQDSQPSSSEPEVELLEPQVESSPALEARLDALQLESPAGTSTDAEQPAVSGAQDLDSPEIDEEGTISKTSEPTAQQDEEDSDEDGWITPANLKKHQAQDSSGAALPSQSTQKTLQAAILTSDYAMQNVALRINLNLVTPSFSRITFLKNWVLRCHGCFSITKDMEKQFCPKCGQPTLTRTSVSTDQHGNFKVHLKKNFQWNNRGNVYSIPKAVHGSANGRLPRHAGGKNNWGKDLIFAEDQKEYTRAADEQRRQRKLDIMDEDYMPGILSGKRSGAGGKIRVGAGRNVNSKRKH